MEANRTQRAKPGIEAKALLLCDRKVIIVRTRLQSLGEAEEAAHAD